jgi:FAD:protein FMN transferase
MPCLLFIALMTLAGCTPAATRFSENRIVMNSPMNIIVYADGEPDWDGIFAYAESVAVLYNHRLPGSPVAELNKNGRARIPEPAFSTVRQALALAEKSGGAYDPTVLTLMQLWDFEGKGHVPTAKELQSALTATGYAKVRVSAPDTIVLSGGTRLDVGGIGEGAVVDATAARLDALGYTAYLVDAAGEIIARGTKPDAESWSVAIRSPRKAGLKRTDPEFRRVYPGNLGVITLETGAAKRAVSTSGDYEKFFVQDGVAYHHILDPRTGAPARGAVAVTVTAPTCAEADSYATAAFVLGFEKGLQFLEEAPGIEGLVVRETDGTLEMKPTSGFPRMKPETPAP